MSLVRARWPAKPGAGLPLPCEPELPMHARIGDPGVCGFDGDRLEQLATVASEPGANGLAWDPAGRCLFVFSPGSRGVAV